MAIYSVSDIQVYFNYIIQKHEKFTNEMNICTYKAIYFKSMMDKVEKFIRRIHWKANFFDNPMMRDNNNYTNHGLRSNISTPQNPALTSFENDIYGMVRNIQFRKVRNDFQDKLKEE